ncbi:MAG: FAD-dependent oxidoreductase [Dehalococcoidales bacterium]|nr:FAD-dependent oxidoreductase [Dehalococcoidales bacterium]
MSLIDEKAQVRSFLHLFMPGNIGNLRLDNRIVMAAMGNALADDSGKVTRAMLEYYRLRAAGHPGMVITQFASISRDDIMPNNLRIHDDSYIPGLSELVRTIHSQGVKACIQLMHPGMLLLLMKVLPGGTTIKAPSITARMAKDRAYKEIDSEDIERYILEFAEAAWRVREAGADALELHACHGCLLSTFLSPAINRRTDSYGGSVENRSRFARLVIEAIRNKLGSEFPLIVRINGCDGVDGGVTTSEVVRQSEILRSAGASAISISSGLEYWSVLMAPSYLTPDGVVIPVAGEVKKVSGIPVIVSGKIGPELADRTVENGWADFIALGRPLLADPGLPDKLRAGKEEEVVRCLYCNNCLRSSWRSCTVNPFLFRESATALSPAAAKKKIAVVGGGLAGMQAAVLCRQRGHDVSLYEKEPELGGQWAIASRLPGKEGYFNAIRHLEHLLTVLKVPVKPGYEITPERMRAIGPDIGIIATGASPVELDLPGANQENTVQANDVIRGRVEVEGKIIVIGTSILALETAVFLAEQGREVVLAGHGVLGGRKGPDDLITFRGLVKRLIDLRVPLYLNAGLLEIDGNALIITIGGEITSLSFNKIVTAIGVRPLDRLSEELKGIVPEIYLAGDCIQPGSAAQATYSAARLALKL